MYSDYTRVHCGEGGVTILKANKLISSVELCKNHARRCGSRVWKRLSWFRRT